MKKKNITLVFVAIVFSIIVGMIIGKSLLKHKEGEPDVVGSFSMNRDENLTVVANRKNISDKEAFTRLLLKMYKENSFHSIKFSTDHGYATSLDTVSYTHLNVPDRSAISRKKSISMWNSIVMEFRL